MGATAPRSLNYAGWSAGDLIQLTNGAGPSVEGRLLRHGKGALAVAPGREAINGQIEARAADWRGPRWRYAN